MVPEQPSLIFLLSAFLFVVFVSVQRVHETFFSKIRRRIRGKVTAKWTLTAMTVVHVLTIFFAYFEYFWFLPKTKPIVSTVGFLFYWFAFFVRQKCIQLLGPYYSVDIEMRDSQRLITYGPYKFVRHPVYFATFFELLSVPLFLNSYRSLMIPILGYYPLLLTRLYFEDKELRRKFGQQYEEYVRRVPALIPRLQRTKIT